VFVRARKDCAPGAAVKGFTGKKIRRVAIDVTDAQKTHFSQRALDFDVPRQVRGVAPSWLGSALDVSGFSPPA